MQVSIEIPRAFAAWTMEKPGRIRCNYCNLVFSLILVSVLIVVRQLRFGQVKVRQWKSNLL
jgi:hypothetical protein